MNSQNETCFCGPGTVMDSVVESSGTQLYTNQGRIHHLHIIDERSHHTFDYLRDFCLPGKIRNIKLLFSPTSKVVPLNFIVENVNDGLTFFSGEDILKKNSR